MGDLGITGGEGGLLFLLLCNRPNCFCNQIIDLCNGVTTYYSVVLLGSHFLFYYDFKCTRPDGSAMPFDVGSNRLKSIATRNTKSTLLAYAVPVLFYSGLVSYFELTSTSYLTFVGMYAICVAFIFASMFAIKNIQNFTHDLGAPLLLSQLVFWLIMSHIWLYQLEEGRAGGLLFALSMLVYTFAYGTLLVAIILNTLVVVGYLAVSYFAIHMHGQPGSMTQEVLAIAAYLPVSIVVGIVGSKLATRKRKVKKLLQEQKNTQHKLEITLKKLEAAASTDELTGLINRREINRRLKYEYHRADRTRASTSIVIMDLDHFKQVNDTYGHPCGDHVLTTIAELLLSEFRVSDHVARWGGEEFMIVMPDTCPKTAQMVVQRIIDKIDRSMIRFENHSVHMTISAGIAELDPNLKLENSLRLADERLYQAKTFGRNQVVVTNFDTPLTDTLPQW